MLEVIFDLLMAMTFTGTISVATSGQEAERTMMISALGCNLVHLVGLGVLFIAGWMLSKYAGAKPWQGGLATAVTGAVLITAIIALGG
jgi:F0F1-type ATP synthase assembly protein I